MSNTIFDSTMANAQKRGSTAQIYPTNMVPPTSRMTLLEHKEMDCIVSAPFLIVRTDLELMPKVCSFAEHPWSFVLSQGIVQAFSIFPVCYYVIYEGVHKLLGCKSKKRRVHEFVCRGPKEGL